MDLTAGLTLGQIKQERARRSLIGFTEYTMEDYKTNWHHRLFASYLEAFAMKKIKRLLIFCPPRHGKSELVSRRLPAFIFGKYPDASIIATSYGADLASRMNRDVQRIMSSPAYKEVFPDSRLWEKNIRTMADGTYLRNSEIFEIVNHKGVYRSAGVGGGITGMGGEYLICDDPIKNAEEAYSKVYRDKVWEWWGSTFFTRLEKAGGICLTLTRWHDDDVAGRLLKLSNADDWTVVSLPAVREDEAFEEDPRPVGEALWPDKYSLEDLAQIKIAIGSRDWNALYRQQPSSESGDMFKKHFWRFYLPEEKPHRFDTISLSCDMAFKDTKTSDYVVMQVWGKLGIKHYLLDEVRERLSFLNSLKALSNLAAKWRNLDECLVEEKANGAAIIDTIRDRIPAVIPIVPKESKEARAAACAPLIEAGQVFLPVPEQNAWVQDFIEEFAHFPKGKFDDRVDACSQYLNRSSRDTGWADKLMDSLDNVESQAMSDNLRQIFWPSQG